jgi:bacterioferritin-associated ferredoxin
MIPPLPAAYVHHLVCPTGIGDLPEPQAAGEIGSMVGGLGARFTLTYASDGADGSVVHEARGRPFGSPALVAPISWLCTAVRGQTWEEAGRHDLPAVLSALRGGEDDAWLPPSVERAAEFALRAFRRALGIGHAGPADCTGPGILVCRCIGVGDRTIRQAIHAGARDPEAIGEATGACTGCRSCRPDVLALLDEETRELPVAPGADRHAVERIALVHGRRLLRGLGQDLADARFDGRQVTLAFGERTPWATVRPIGAVALVRHILRETVHDDIRVGPSEA